LWEKVGMAKQKKAAAVVRGEKLKVEAES